MVAQRGVGSVWTREREFHLISSPKNLDRNDTDGPQQCPVFQVTVLTRIIYVV